ncbi:hypothetical protein DRP77_02495, partial [Candidatus Poribacteria bacterium]
MRIKASMIVIAFILNGICLAGVYYVAPDGSDLTGDGSEGNPWATISKAIRSVPDGSVIKVRPGEYFGRVHLGRAFEKGVIVESEVPYQAVLRNNGIVVAVYGGANITFRGFDVAHS